MGYVKEMLTNSNLRCLRLNGYREVSHMQPVSFALGMQPTAVDRTLDVHHCCTESVHGMCFSCIGVRSSQEFDGC